MPHVFPIISISLLSTKVLIIIYNKFVSHCIEMDLLQLLGIFTQNRSRSCATTPSRKFLRLAQRSMLEFLYRIWGTLAWIENVIYASISHRYYTSKNEYELVHRSAWKGYIHDWIGPVASSHLCHECRYNIEILFEYIYFFRAASSCSKGRTSFGKCTRCFHKIGIIWA